MPRSAIREIDIAIDQPFDVELTDDWLHIVVQQAMSVALGNDEPGYVSLLVTDDTTVRDLNRGYRGLDEVTDVLSFSADFPGHWEGEYEDVPQENNPEASSFILPPGQLTPLGEVVISYPQAQRQATEKGHSVKDELALLVVHGVLHLVGHDHLEDADTALMQSKERIALQAIFQMDSVSL